MFNFVKMFAHKQKGCSLLLKTYGMKDFFLFIVYFDSNDIFNQVSCCTCSQKMTN